MTFSYLETSKRITSGINPEALASMAPGNELGRGSGFAFRQVGQLVVADTTEIHVGIKTPIRDRSEVEMRVAGEMAFLEYVMQRSLQLIPKIPRFMSLVSLEGDESPAAILTEDVSQGGSKQVRSIPASRDTLEGIYRPFQKLGPMAKVVREEECDNTLAFDVAGAEMLLDFTPLPVELFIYNIPAYRTGFGVAYDAIPDLTITIPRDSELGSALTLV